MDKNIVGHKIRIYRAMQKPQMRQAELLAKLQVNGLTIDQSTLSKIENQDRPVSDIELLIIAKTLKVDILWLLGEKD